MKKYLLPYCLLLNFQILYSQNIGINNDGSSPHASAMLDIKSFNKGLLIPRMTTAQRNAIEEPALGLKVFDSETRSFWFFNGTDWLELSNNNNSWNVNGNAISNPMENFIGTINEQPLQFRINNTWAGELHPLNGTVFLGLMSGESNSGIYNTGIGAQALFSNTIGNNNTAIGAGALHLNTTGEENTALGRAALFSNSTGTNNIAIGSLSLFSSTEISNCIAIGVQALYLNTTGENNLALGSQSLLSNSTGSNNIGIGMQALYSNLSGDRNIAVGPYALNSNLTGNNNIAIGDYCLRYNSTGRGNTAMGAGSLLSNTTGSENTSIGEFALFINSTGQNNTAVGNSALSNLMSGTLNIGIGSSSNIGFFLENAVNTVGIGNYDYHITTHNQVIIGSTSTTFIGGKVNWGIISDGRVKDNIAENVSGLDFIMKLRPVTYNINSRRMLSITGNSDSLNFPGKYDGDKIRYAGFIAQEVEQAALASGFEFSGYNTPKNDWDLYTLRYAEFVVPLVKGMQEQQVKIDMLQTKVEELTNKLLLLEAEIKSIKSAQK